MGSTKDPIREAKLVGSCIGSYQKGKLVGSWIGSYSDRIKSALFSNYLGKHPYKLNVHYSFTEMNF